MEGMGSDAFSKASDGSLEKVGPCDFSFGGEHEQNPERIFYFCLKWVNDLNSLQLQIVG